jgi:hypothetical protein
MAVTLFLGSLDYSATSQSLTHLFWDHVVPKQIQVVADRESGRSKGFGFLQVSTPEDAVMACRVSRDLQTNGRRINVSVLRKEESSSRSLRLLRGYPEHIVMDAASPNMSIDVFRQELLSALDVSDLDESWIAASLTQLSHPSRTRHDEPTRHQLLRLIDALASSVESMPDVHPRLFEFVVGALLAASDYQSVRVSGPSADGGIDIVASKTAGFGRSLFVVQCKRYAPSRKVDRPTAQLIYGVSAERDATKAMLVTTSSFTRPASEFLAANGNQMAGLDGQDLEVWLQATAQVAREPLTPEELGTT